MPIPQTFEQPFIAECAIWYRKGQDSVRVFTNDTDPYSRGAMLRQFLEEDVEEGDVLYTGRGDYFFGADSNLTLWAGSPLKGPGAEHCRLYSEVVSDNEGNAFCLTDSLVEDLTLEVKPRVSEDSRLIGYDTEEAMRLNLVPRPQTARRFGSMVRRCRLLGSDWCVYNWANFFSYLRLEDCYVEAARIAIAAASSGAGPFGTGGQHFDIVRCNLLVDASKSKSIGATSHIRDGLGAGVVARGGIVNVLGCQSTVIGNANPGPSSNVPRLADVTDWYGEPDRVTPSSDSLRLSVEGLVSNVKAGPDAWTLPKGTKVTPSPECWDVDLRNPVVIQNLRWAGGFGSGPKGAFTQRQPALPA